MNKHRLRITHRAVVELFLAALLTVAGYAQDPARPNPPASSGGSATAPTTSALAAPAKVVLKVGNEQITQAEFDSLIGGLNPQTQQAVSAQGRRNFGERYALMLVLSQLALTNHFDSTPDVRRQMMLQRLQLLANAEYQNLSHQAEPKPDEVSEYYAAHQTEFEQAQVRKIFIRKRPEGAKEGAPLGLTPEEAKARAEEIRKALAAAPDGKKVAEQYRGSKDVLVDAEPRMVGRAQLAADLDKAAFQLKEGELSDPQDTPQAITFIQVTKRGYKELKDVRPQIQRQLQRKKLEDTLAELKTKAGIWMDDEYFKAPPARGTQPVPSDAPTPKAQSLSGPPPVPPGQTPKPVSKEPAKPN